MVKISDFTLTVNNTVCLVTFLATDLKIVCLDHSYYTIMITHSYVRVYAL